MPPLHQLSTHPVCSSEWRPSRDPSYSELSNLPQSVDGAVGAYPLRGVAGRLLDRGPRGGSDCAVVGLHDGPLLTYSGYVGSDADGLNLRRAAVDARICRVLATGRHSGAVIGAVGRRVGGELRPIPPGESGELCGVVFDLTLSSLAYVFSSPLLALDGQYLVRELRLRAVALDALDDVLPGAAVIAALRAGGAWPSL